MAEPVRREPWPLRVIRSVRDDPTLRREADTSGFYAAIALIVALTAAGNDHAPHSQWDVLRVVWSTTLGLALAHWFALTLAARVVDDPEAHHSPAQVLTAQLMMATAVAAVSTVVVLLLSPDVERLGARLAAAVSIAAIVWFELRHRGRTHRHALVVGAVALAVGGGVALAKWLISR